MRTTKVRRGFYTHEVTSLESHHAITITAILDTLLAILEHLEAKDCTATATVTCNDNPPTK